MSTSGPEDCLCSFESPCVLDLDLIVDILDPVYTELDCQNLCRLESECSYYSWFDFEGTLFEEECILLSSCEKTNVTLEGCHSGPESCEYVRPILPMTVTSINIISSQNFPENYTLGIDNTWNIISAIPYARIEILFWNFTTHSSHFLTITDGNGTELLRHSGDSLPSPSVIVSNTNIVVINFKPVGGSTQQGFLLTWKTIPVEAKHEASKELPRVIDTTNSLMCWTNNSTWQNDMSETIMDVHSAKDCQVLCHLNHKSGYGCNDFTWFSSSALSYQTMCMLYPSVSTPTDCTHCVSGPSICHRVAK